MGKKSRKRPGHKAEPQPAAPPSPSPLSSPSDQSTQTRVDAGSGSSTVATSDSRQVPCSRSQQVDPVPWSGPSSPKGAKNEGEDDTKQGDEIPVDIDEQTLRDGLSDVVESKIDTPAAHKVRAVYPLLRFPEDFSLWALKLVYAYQDGGVTATPDTFSEVEFQAALALVDKPLLDEDVTRFRAQFLHQRVPPRPASAARLPLPWAVHLLFHYIDSCS